MLRTLAILLLLVVPAYAGWPDSRIVHMEDGGSGSFVRIGDCTMILSCAHRTIDTSVERGYQVRYVCADDSQGTATVIAVYPFDINSKPFRDVAIYVADRQPPNGTVPFRLTNSETPANAKVWIVGFPGPGMQFSSRATQTIGYDGMLLLAGQSIPGESGGPIIDERGEIVGTLSGNIGGVTYACPGVVIGDLFREVKTTWCPNGRCPSCPQQQWQPVQQPIVRQELPPPPQPLNPPIKEQPAQPQPPSLTAAEVDAKIIPLQNKIDELQKQLAQCKPCQCGDCAAKCDQKIALAIAGIKIPQPVQPKPTTEEHVVVVADHNSPYWTRLADTIATTRKTYSGVQDTTLPKFPIGTHPQAVVYRNSVPVRVVKGQYEVEALLNRLARGESI